MEYLMKVMVYRLSCIGHC